MNKFVIFFSLFQVTTFLYTSIMAQVQTSTSAPSQNKALPNVVILATGGMIAGAAKSGTQASYTSGQVTIDAMINYIRGEMKIVNIKCEQI